MRTWIIVAVIIIGVGLYYNAGCAVGNRIAARGDARVRFAGNTGSANGYVSPARILQSGKYLYIPGYSGKPSPVFTDKQGKEIGIGKIALHILTLKSAQQINSDAIQYAFAVEGYPTIVLATVKKESAQIFFQCISDHDTRLLASHMNGKRVWCYPGTNVLYPTTMPDELSNDIADLSASYRVNGVFRLIGFNGWGRRCLQIGAWGGDPQSNYTFHNGILIRLVRIGIDPRFKSTHHDDVTMYVNGKPFPPPANTPLVANAKERQCFIVGEDANDISRRLSTVFPFARRMPRRVRHAILSNNVVAGMTHDEVAWAYGWPSEIGSPETLRKFNTWTYDNLTPFSFIVEFQNGRMVSAQASGHLP